MGEKLQVKVTINGNEATAEVTYFETEAKFDYGGRTYNVKVTEGELKTLEYVPEGQRSAVKRSILTGKVEALLGAAIRRTEFNHKVTDKGKLSIYGLSQRFPVTLSKAAWLKILDNAEAIRGMLAQPNVK